MMFFGGMTLITLIDNAWAKPSAKAICVKRATTNRNAQKKACRSLTGKKRASCISRADSNFRKAIKSC